MSKVTVEVSPNGTVKIIGADEYESSAVIQQVFNHRLEVSRINARAVIYQAIAPWVCLAPVFLVLWTLIWIAFRPMPDIPTEQNSGSYQSYVSQ
jgi:hypothetical protein